MLLNKLRGFSQAIGSESVADGQFDAWVEPEFRFALPMLHVDVEGFPACHPDDIIASKAATNRVKDRESLPRLRAFRDCWMRKLVSQGSRP